QCKYEILGYSCCSHCHSIYEDQEGLWGVEHDQWCGITEECQTLYEECWSIKKGYPCCNHCKVHTMDKSGAWGIMDNNWCGI
ncbi:Non-catalytic module family DOC2, partial [Piromyces sp. E2]